MEHKETRTPSLTKNKVLKLKYGIFKQYSLISAMHFLCNARYKKDSDLFTNITKLVAGLNKANKNFVTSLKNVQEKYGKLVDGKYEYGENEEKVKTLVKRIEGLTFEIEYEKPKMPSEFLEALSINEIEAIKPFFHS